ncbi:unnamed protein product, partial [Coregonus sp. 'balchen']
IAPHGGCSKEYGQDRGATRLVADWGQTQDRAFQWTQREHLYTRFSTNPAIIEILEKQLQATNESLRTIFQGYIDITFSDLSQCQHLLLVGTGGSKVDLAEKLLDSSLQTSGGFENFSGVVAAALPSKKNNNNNNNNNYSSICLEYDMDKGEWVQMYATNGVSFKTLAGHYTAGHYQGACLSPKEGVERELTTPKVVDGDFDVRGLSLWTVPPF